MIHLISDLVPMIIKDAPLVASSLLSPGAGVVVQLLCNAFQHEKDGIESLPQYIQNDPDSATKLKQFESDNGDALRKMMGCTWPSSIDINIKLTWPQQQN